MFLVSSASDLSFVAGDLLSGLWTFIEFLVSLPLLFYNWYSGMPEFFQLGIVLVVTCIILVIVLKIKTYILF